MVFGPEEYTQARNGRRTCGLEDPKRATFYPYRPFIEPIKAPSLTHLDSWIPQMVGLIYNYVI